MKSKIILIPEVNKVIKDESYNIILIRRFNIPSRWRTGLEEFWWGLMFLDLARNKFSTLLENFARSSGFRKNSELGNNFSFFIISAKKSELTIARGFSES